MLTFLIAVVLIVILYLVQERIDISLADEGFLWNGTHRTLSGLIPTRDFKSYDPGRFYWTAVFSSIFGRGILGIRRSVTLFQFLGLWAGLEVIATLHSAWWSITLTGIVMLWWMQPRHKRFEHTVSLISIWVAFQLFEASTSWMYLAAGCFVGIAAFMGRNHGAYALMSFSAFFLILNFESEASLFIERGLFAGAGIILGYSPMLLMWLLVPRMFTKYISDKIMNLLSGRVLKYVKLDFPWPWRFDKQALHTTLYLSFVLLGVYFIVMPIIYLGSIILVLSQGVPQQAEWVLLLISSTVGLFYLHHGLIRPDHPHLCQVTQPFIVTIYCIASLLDSQLMMFTIFIIFIISSFLLVNPIHPVMNKLRNTKHYVAIDINGETLYLQQGLANLLTALKEFVETDIGKHQPIFIAPNMATLYPVLEVKTPVFSDFLLFPESDQKQQEMIDDLEHNKVNWLFINEQPLDRREELRFSNTHPQVWDYFSREFKPVEFPGNLPPEHRFYKRKSFLN